MSDEEPPAVLPPAIEPNARVLDQDLVTEIVQHINEKATAPNDACPVCSSPKNFVASTLYSLATVPAENAPFSNQHMPLYATVCMDCGFVRLFSELRTQQLIKADHVETLADGEASGD